MDSKIIFDVCEELFKEFESDISNFADRLAISIIQKRKENNIPTKVPYKDEPNASVYSKDYFLLNDRIISMIKNHFVFSFFCSITKKDLKERLGK
ncbi:hypothetical protein KKF82_06630 [Patescibacteria group bacterium]|nr:hypothetical protein [Patescibacteria group bacterium]